MSTPQEIDYQAEMLANKVKHYLITIMGATLDEANQEEFYRAFATDATRRDHDQLDSSNHTY